MNMETNAISGKLRNWTGASLALRTSVLSTKHWDFIFQSCIVLLFYGYKRNNNNSHTPIRVKKILEQLSAFKNTALLNLGSLEQAIRHSCLIESPIRDWYPIHPSHPQHKSALRRFWTFTEFKNISYSKGLGIMFINQWYEKM